MPIIQENHLQEQVFWAVWALQETEEALLAQLHGLYTAQDFAHKRHEQHRLQSMGARLALVHLQQRLGLALQPVQALPSGMPVLKDTNLCVSLTHCQGYAAAALSLQGPVGIDMEGHSSRLLRIAPRIFSEQELAQCGQDVEALTRYWCAKEALYKFQGIEGVDFRRDLQVMEGGVQAEVLPSGQRAQITYAQPAGDIQLALCR